MKYTILVVVLTLLLKPVLPVVGYIINYDYIVKELCENKAKPELHCNGKCHLMKGLADASEDEKPVSSKKIMHSEAEVLFFQELIYASFTQDYSIQNEVETDYKNLYFYLTFSKFYHPPAIV